jgi:predicted MPP superfamily phosphohydrolase
MCLRARLNASNAIVKTESPELKTTASPVSAHPISRRRTSLPVVIAVLQSVLFVIHYFLYATWTFFWGKPELSHALALQIALGVLAVSFIAASLLAHEFFNPAVRAIYTVAATWLGFVNYFFLGACACWIVYTGPLLFGLYLDRQLLAAGFFGIALLTSLYGIVNASRIRTVRITVKLPGLPPAWRGRTAALVSDLHLGPVRNGGFLRRVIRKLSQLDPDILFIPGDLYDGTAADLDHLSKPWSAFHPPLGSYFVTGNHEQFTSPTKYLEAVREAGIRVLENEKILIDGLQIVGVHYRDATNTQRFRSILRHASIDPNAASILLVHNPNRLALAEEAGISLQLSGHTHRGQFFPWTGVVSRLYGRYAYGLQRFGGLAVYTSCGVGTWGPPMRLGSNPEIVLIHFE